MRSVFQTTLKPRKCSIWPCVSVLNSQASSLYVGGHAQTLDPICHSRHVDNATQCQVDAENRHGLSQTQGKFTSDSSASCLFLTPSKDHIFTVQPDLKEFDTVAVATGASVGAEKLQRHGGLRRGIRSASRD